MLILPDRPLPPTAIRLMCVSARRRAGATNGQESLQTRFRLGAEGVFGGWDYNTAFARSVSQNTQTLTNGYYDRNLLLAAFKTGKINPSVRRRLKAWR
jgi:hypothetical protein